MLYVTREGHVDAERIKIKIFSTIERGQMAYVHGIVVHQTNSPTALGTFNSYARRDANGAHFLIDKDGSIYQTASLYRVTHHGGYLQSRCVITQQCTPTALKHAQSLERISGSRRRSEAVHANESAKQWPDRYPFNTDSLGIELVGVAVGDRGKEVYEPVTAAQSSSLKWLVKELVETLGVSMNEIYRHPEIGRKNVTEASPATW